MYQILVRYTSNAKKTFWYDYKVEQEDGTTTVFQTEDEKELTEEINKLDKQIGFENIRVVNDISYIVSAKLEGSNIEIATPDDIDTDDIDDTETDEIKE